MSQNVHGPKEKPQKNHKRPSQPDRLREEEIFTQGSHPASDVRQARRNPASLTPAAVLQLQRMIGNQAVQRLLARRAPSQEETGIQVKEQFNTTLFPIQRAVYQTMAAMWAAVHPGYAIENIRRDSALAKWYDDAAAQLPLVDFVQVPNTGPQITPTGNAHPLPKYRLDHDTAATNAGGDDHAFASKIIHELVHAASAEMYNKPGINMMDMTGWADLNLPPAVGPVVEPNSGMTQNQRDSLNRQLDTIMENYDDLRAEADADLAANRINQAQHTYLTAMVPLGRITYAQVNITGHNESVIGEIMYWLRANNRRRTRTYKFARRMLKEANSRRRNDIWSGPETEVRRVDRGKKFFQFWKW